MKVNSMYTRYYDSYPTETEPKIETENTITPPPAENSSGKNISVAKIAPVGKNLFGNLSSEDLLLIALLFITVTESGDDFILPLILGALLLE